MWYTWKHNQIGTQHMAECQPYEDSCLMVQTCDDRLILAVADGHGDPLCVRAKEGARFACEAAVNILSHADTFDRDRLVRIKAYFDHLVRFDLMNHPLDQEESEVLRYLPAEYTYGTTLLCAVISGEGTFRCQIGDGTLVLVGLDGRLLPPLEEDSQCYGNTTTSMIDPNAADLFRWDFTPEPAAAALLHTDGYDDGSPQSLGLLNQLLDPPARIPDAVLQDGSHGDDQTVLMALHKACADSDVFRIGLSLECQILMIQNEIRRLEFTADMCRRTIACLDACLFPVDEERQEPIRFRRENRSKYLMALEERIQQQNDELTKVQNAREAFFHSLEDVTSDEADPSADREDSVQDSAVTLPEETQESEMHPVEEAAQESADA